MPTQKISPAILLAAIEGFEQQKQRIDAQIADLKAMLPGQPVVTPEALTATRRPMSAAARKRIADAQRKRWAESKGNTAVTPEPEKPKSRLSEAGKAAIVAALRKRMAANRAAKVAQAVALKKAAVKRAPAKKAATVKKGVGEKVAAPTTGE